MFIVPTIIIVLIVILIVIIMVVIIISRDGGGGSNSSSNNKVILEEVEEVVVVAALFALLICLSIVLSLRCSSLLLVSLSFYHCHFHWYHQVIVVTVYIQIGSYVPNYILYIHVVTLF